MDPFANFKAAQREGWSLFAPLEMITTAPAAKLARFAGVSSGQRVLDVACGTGVVAVTCAQLGATVTGLDLTPALLERARENAQIAGVSIDFHEGDAESLPYADASFDTVVSQFGHIFAPHPTQAVGEMIRVLKPGGTIAFSTWPPELFMGRMFTLVGSYLPPPPQGAAPPPQWGDPNIVRERLGSAVRYITFDRDLMLSPALSVNHFLRVFEQTAGPMVKLVQLLQGEPERLEEFRNKLRTLIAEYRHENQVHQSFLMTRATRI